VSVLPILCAREIYGQKAQQPQKYPKIIDGNKYCSYIPRDGDEISREIEVYLDHTFGLSQENLKFNHPS
jgi:hypothetical protein